MIKHFLIDIQLKVFSHKIFAYQIEHLYMQYL